jgi:hypothetical protein
MTRLDHSCTASLRDPIGTGPTHPAAGATTGR